MDGNRSHEKCQGVAGECENYWIQPDTIGWIF